MDQQDIQVMDLFLLFKWKSLKINIDAKVII